jgi:hypothetical protein
MSTLKQHGPDFWYVILAMAAVVCLGLLFCRPAPAANLLPDAVLVEANHTSSVLQHFSSDPTTYGYTTVSGFVHWDLPKHGYLDIGDGHTVGPAHLGDLKDIFQARVGVRINLGR